jgi:hypothetical protein
MEPASHFAFLSALAYWATIDKRAIVKIVGGYYLVAGLLTIKINLMVGTGVSNIPLYALLCLLTSFGLGVYFYNVLLMRWKKILVLLFCATNAFYYVFNNVIQAGVPVFDSMAYVILSFTIVIMIFLFMRQLLNQIGEEPLSMNFDFWFVTSQLFYFLGSFAIFLMYGYLTTKVLATNVKTSTALSWLWGLHNILLFLSALITLGSVIWISSRKKSLL